VVEILAVEVVVMLYPLHIWLHASLYQ